MLKRKNSQIWVETVVYILIGLAIIGLLLSIIKPEIEKRKDKLLIEKSLEMLDFLKNKIEDIIYYGPGNSRTIEITIKKGLLNINGEEDKIEFSMESSYLYSEINKSITQGGINIKTSKKGNHYVVSLVLNYSDVNITWDNKDIEHVLQKSSAPHKLLIMNKGETGDIIQIDFS